MTSWLSSSTIFVTLAGSHAHGTARDGSDLDFRGICVAPMATRLSLFGHFEQYEGDLDETLAALVRDALARHDSAAEAEVPKTEVVIFDVAKLVSLLAVANPNALEIVFADARDWLFVTPRFRRLHAERHRFLTKKVAQTFVGYAMAQLRRIRTHRAWLLEPPTTRPTRAEFDLPESTGTLSRDDQNRIEQSIAEKLRSYRVDDVEMPKATRLAVEERIEAFIRDALGTESREGVDPSRDVATSALGLPGDVIATLERERRYRGALKHWDAYQTWQRGRNPARADLERRHGYDTKHAMHLVRLMRMGHEVLVTGDLRVRRDDAVELRALREGSLSFDELLATTTELEIGMKRAAETSSLPTDVDRAFVDALLLELIADEG